MTEERREREAAMAMRDARIAVTTRRMMVQNWRRRRRCRPRDVIMIFNVGIIELYHSYTPWSLSSSVGFGSAVRDSAWQDHHCNYLNELQVDTAIAGVHFI